jgi:hypothetical protein
VIAVKLPLVLLGQLRHFLTAPSLHAGSGTQGQSTMGGSVRMRTAHARLRSATFEGVPSLGRSAGRAAGAMGAPAGGPVGAAGRGLAGAARRSGMLPGAAGGLALGAAAEAVGASRGAMRRERGGLRERLRSSGAILANAPRDARAAMAVGSGKAVRVPGRAAGARGSTPGARPVGAGNATGTRRATLVVGQVGRGGAGVTRAPERPRASRPASPNPASRTQPQPQRGPAAGGQARAPAGTPPTAHPGRKVATNARREARAPAQPQNASGKAARAQRPAKHTQRTNPARPAPAPRSQAPKPRPRAKRRPPPRSGS